MIDLPTIPVEGVPFGIGLGSFVTVGLGLIYTALEVRRIRGKYLPEVERELERRIRAEVEAEHGLAPRVEDAKAWAAPSPPPPTFVDALAVVLELGATLRQCMGCQSLATEYQAEHWVRATDGEVYVRLVETCQECDSQRSFFASPSMLAAMNAMGAWEQGTTAHLAANATISDAELHADLADLDGPPPSQR